MEQWSYLDTLAIAQSADGDYAEAEKTWRRLLPLLEEGVGVESTGVLRLLDNLAENLNKQERFAEAEAVQMDLCVRTEKSAGSESVDLLQRRRVLAEIRQKMELWRKAEKTWREVLEGCRTLDFSESIYYAECLEGLAACLTALGDKEAETYLRDAATQRARLGAARQTPASRAVPSAAKLGLVAAVLLGLIRIVMQDSSSTVSPSTFRPSRPFPRQNSSAFRDTQKKSALTAPVRLGAHRANVALAVRANRVHNIDHFESELDRMRLFARGAQRLFGPKSLLAAGMVQTIDVGRDVLSRARMNVMLRERLRSPAGQSK